MTGYERKNIEAGSVRWGLLTPHDSILRTHEATGERHAVQSVHLCEKEFVRQDGAIGWGLFAGSKLADKTGAITFMADITEQKRTMLELQSANDRLATADEEMDTLIHAVSHDLRSPLWIVDNFSEALRDEMASSLDGKAKDYLLHIQDSVYRMTDTIDAMLRIPRLTRGDLKRVSVDLSGLARSIADELGKNEPARQVELSIADGHSASGDPILLRNVLENLLDNAWKFTGKQREARIEFGAIQKDGNTIFFVRDNGVGFNMDRAEKLFYAFHRFHSSKDFPGLGVGLAIVRRIIRRHCGKVWANSEPDKGSTFYFSLWDRCCTSLSEPEL